MIEVWSGRLGKPCSVRTSGAPVYSRAHPKVRAPEPAVSRPSPIPMLLTTLLLSAATSSLQAPVEAPAQASEKRITLEQTSRRPGSEAINLSPSLPRARWAWDGEHVEVGRGEGATIPEMFSNVAAAISQSFRLPSSQSKVEGTTMARIAEDAEQKDAIAAASAAALQA